MPQEKIPNPLERRHLIERDLPGERSLAIAEAYLAEGRTNEAVIFLQKAGARDRLAQLPDQAVGEGDAFLLRSIQQALGEEPPPERWEQLAEVAEAAGKLRHAETARRQATRHDT